MRTITVILLLLAVSASAEDRTLTWTNATQRVDGTPFLRADILETRIYCGIDPATFDGSEVPTVVRADAGESVINDFPIGIHNCFATHVDLEGQISDPSNVITIIVLASRPAPPNNFSVN